MRLSARRRPGQAKGARWRALEFLLEVPSRRCETKLNEILLLGGRRRRSVELTLIGFTVFTGTSEASKEGSKVTGVLGYGYACLGTCVFRACTSKRTDT